jgi:nucleotide-binding universal stress UspA family protein
LKRMLLGSVASEVVKYADCPVLIIKWQETLLGK